MVKTWVILQQPPPQAWPQAENFMWNDMSKEERNGKKHQCANIVIANTQAPPQKSVGSWKLMSPSALLNVNQRKYRMNDGVWKH